MPPDPGAVADAVTAAIGGITAGGAPVPVHLADVPGGTTIPYFIVTPSAGGRLDGTLADATADGDLVVLVTSVTERKADGQGARQCQVIQRFAQLALLDEPLTVDGAVVLQVRLDVPGGVQTDRETEPARFYAVDRFVIATTP